MNTLVLFEIGLAVSCLVSLFLMRRTYFPMNLFWAVGVVAIGMAALLGAFVYGGFGAVKPYHSQVSAFASSIGLASFALAALGGAFARQFHEAGWWIVLFAVTALIAVLLFDLWKLSEIARYSVVGILALAAFYRLVTNAATGIFLLLGVAALVVGGLAGEWLAGLAGMQQLNVFHLLMSLSVLSFGAFAAKE